jgi:hypothetical protein
MDLHANAALSLNKRRLLLQRVVDLGWTLTSRPPPWRRGARLACHGGDRQQSERALSDAR